MQIGEFAVPEGTLRYRRWTAAGSSPIFVQLHGIESHSGWFAAIGEGLADRGITTLSLDRIGSGQSDGERGHVDRGQVWRDHVGRFIDWVREQYRPPSLYIVGSCWGGKLALSYALHRPNTVDGLILISAGLRTRVDLPLAQKLRIAWALRKHPTTPFPVPIPRDDMFTRLPAALEYIGADPLRLHHVTARFLYEMRKMDHANGKDIGQLGMPVLALFAQGDVIVDVPAALGVLRRASSSTLRIKVLQNVYHCMEFGTADLVTGEIVDWVRTAPGRMRQCA